MEHEEIIYDNNRRVDYLIANIMRIVAYGMLLVLVLSYNNVLEISENALRMDLIFSSVLLSAPTLFMYGWNKLKKMVKYIIMTCVSLVSIVIMSHFMSYTFILAAIPLVLACLYFDKELEIYTMLLMGMGIVGASFVYEMGANKLFDGIGQLGENFIYELTIRMVQYSFLACIILYLSDHCIKRFERAIADSEELKRNRDGLDVIVDYTDALFCARSYQEIATIILFIIQNLLSSIENAPKEVQGCVGIRQSKGIFNGVNEKVEPLEFQVQNQVVMVQVEDEEYLLPILENEESSTVFVNKNRLTMFFYSEGRLVAFVILHIHLNQTEGVLNKLIRVLYRNIRLAIRNIKLSHEMYETQEELVRAFSEISESKSGQTGRHIKRVSEYMKIMAAAMDLEREESDSLVIASMMHDIGKLLVPEAILEKPGKLTAEEFEVIKTHVHLGYKLLEFSPGRIMEIARVIALQHHEKWDGTGYLGLKGDEIDYYSRIMAVVDVFDALMSKRSYKESWSIEEAYNEIISQSGKHFDPQVVEMFKAHFNEFLEVLNNYPDCEKTA